MKRVSPSAHLASRLLRGTISQAELRSLGYQMTKMVEEFPGRESRSTPILDQMEILLCFVLLTFFPYPRKILFVYRRQSDIELSSSNPCLDIFAILIPWFLSRKIGLLVDSRLSVVQCVWFFFCF